MEFEQVKQPSYEEIKSALEKQSSSIVKIHLMRHSIKDSDPKAQDKNINIKKDGFDLINSKRVDFDNPEWTVIYGGPKIRTGQTASYFRDDEKSNLYNSDDEEVNFVDERLNFSDDYSLETNKKGIEAMEYDAWLYWLVNQSDKDAEESRESDNEDVWSYQHFSQNIANFLLDRINESEKWNEKVKEKKEQDGSFEKTLNEIVSSHQGILESFLAKVIEETEDVSKRDSFIDVLNGKGFSETEGFNIEVLNMLNGEKRIFLEYSKKSEEDNDENGIKKGDVIFEFKKEITKEFLEKIIKK